MNVDGWLRVPVGRDAEQWRTTRVRRIVLGVVHTVASAEAVLDAVDLAAVDQRIQTVYTQAPDVFDNGVREHLQRAGAVVVPWSQAVNTDVDLAVTADCAGVHELRAPILMLSHGVVNNKTAPPALGGPANAMVVGLAAPWLTWYGRLVPAAVAVSHRDAVDVLRRQCPQALRIVSVTGDLTLDRLRASAPIRADLRRALGVRDGRTLVAVSSTWGADSLFGGRWRDLLDQLLELPADGYAVRVVVHPAVWFGHGQRQVLAWLERHRRGGVRLVRPTDWRGLVAGADVLIGDHGSATVYAAAAGVPVLRAVGRSRFTAPGSAAEVLARVTTMVSSMEPMAGQLDTAVRAGADTNRQVARAVSSAPSGAAPASLRRVMYRLLRLAEPRETPRAAPVGLPRLVDEESICHG